MYIIDRFKLVQFVHNLKIEILHADVFFKNIFCFNFHQGKRMGLFIQNIPIFMCMVFLCVSFPARLIRSVRKLMARVVGSFVEFSAQEIDRIKETPQGRYVQGLLRKKLSSRNQS